MAKITRYNGNLVAPASAALGTERTLFGDVTQSDDLTDQFTADLLRGWGIVGPSDFPTLNDFNAVGFTLGQLHAYLHQMGVAEYNAAQEYHTGSIANVAGVLYVSLVDTNVGNAPASSPSQWSPQSEHGMIVFDSAGVTAWTVPLAMQLGVIKPKVTVIGGGGGAGRKEVGGGGGAGGGISESVLDLTGVTSVTVTVGAGGPGAPAGSGNANGTAGGTSSFGGYTSSTGGGAGANWSGGAGGVGIGGAFNSSLGPGGNAARNDATASPKYRGGNGGGPGGTASSAGAAGSAGNNAVSPGGGGGGGNENAAGGAGADGAVIIEW